MRIPFDKIEQRLAKMCNDTKCIRDRVQAHREASAIVDADAKKTLPEKLTVSRLPFSQHKR